MTDFVTSRNYENEIDAIVAPSEDFTSRNGVTSEKLFFLGSPKYDFLLDSSQSISKKYKIDNTENKKNALVIFPRARDLSRIDMLQIYDVISEKGYNIIVKTRGKDPIPENMKGDYSFSDFTWFPHSSLELIQISDVVVNFSSTVVKECLMLDTPLMNFHIKPFNRPLDYLYDYDYNTDMKIPPDKNQIQEALAFFENKDDLNFSKARDEHLFDPTDTCKKIIQKFI